MKIKENYDLKFSDAKNVYIEKLNEIEMNRKIKYLHMQKNGRVKKGQYVKHGLEAIKYNVNM